MILYIVVSCDKDVSFQLLQHTVFARSDAALHYISRRSRIVAAPQDVLNEIVAALEY